MDGTYSRTVWQGWSGTIGAAVATGTLAPAGRSLDNVTGDRSGQDFSWTPPLHAFAGVVTNLDTGAGEEGVTLTFSGGLGTVATGPDGSYAQQVYAGWSGTVVPARSDGTFLPATQAYVAVTGALTNQNFTLRPNRIVSGRTLDADTGAPLGGIEIEFAYEAGTATSAADGSYARALPHGWSGTATPQAGTNAWAALPATRTYANLTADRSDQDYQLQMYRRIAGRVTDLYTGAGKDGVTIRNATAGGQVATANGGYYELAVRDGFSGRLAVSYRAARLFRPTAITKRCMRT